MKRLFPFILIAVISASCTQKQINLPSRKVINENHFCKWAQCPYHGIKPDQFRYIVEYVGNYGSDSYYIDSLHLAYPTAEYEELETRLETIK